MLYLRDASISSRNTNLLIINYITQEIDSIGQSHQQLLAVQTVQHTKHWCIITPKKKRFKNQIMIQFIGSVAAILLSPQYCQDYYQHRCLGGAFNHQVMVVISQITSQNWLRLLHHSLSPYFSVVSIFFLLSFLLFLRFTL